MLTRAEVVAKPRVGGLPLIQNICDMVSNDYND